jgi:D-tyrosyl-tRNA(Tyr) deacylase
MRAVAQRVKSARVTVDDETVGEMAAGLLVYLGAGKDDQLEQASWMAEKLATLRIFEDEAGKMSRSVAQSGSHVLVVSQFTLYGDVRNGRRPSFVDAAPPEHAQALYEAVCAQLRARGMQVATGRFRAMMQVHAVVDGPVTILIDSEKVF